MIFFSGFSLRGEEELFGEFLDPYGTNPYVVAGFSYGAQKALEYAWASKKRIDRLLLLSPAWFLDRNEAFRRLQLRAFGKDPSGYLKNFLANAAHPTGTDLSRWFEPGGVEELEALLRYPWPKEKLEDLGGRGVRLEVYLGGRDRIVNAAEAHAFFRAFGESWLFKEAGHLLRP